MASNLESVKGEDWAKFRSLLEALDLDDEETQAVGETILAVQSMRPEFSVEKRNEALHRQARMSKIIDVAIALKVFDRLPHHQWATEDGMTGIRSAATRLMEALALVSNKYEVEEAVQRRGLIISNDEAKEAIERGRQVNVV
jgi:hypothetical protein